MAGAKSFAIVMKEQFGTDCTLTEFYKDFKTLSEEDKAWYKAELKACGHEIEDNQTTAIVKVA